MAGVEDIQGTDNILIDLQNLANQILSNVNPQMLRQFTEHITTARGYVKQYEDGKDVQTISTIPGQQPANQVQQAPRPGALGVGSQSPPSAQDPAFRKRVQGWMSSNNATPLQAKKHLLDNSISPAVVSALFPGV